MGNEVYEGKYTIYDRFLKGNVEQECVIKVRINLAGPELAALEELITNYQNYLMYVVPLYRVILTPINNEGARSAIIVTRKELSLESYLAQYPNEFEDIYPHLVNFVQTCHEHGIFHLELSANKIIIEKTEYSIKEGQKEDS